MLVAYRQSFVKDLAKIRSRRVRLRVREEIGAVERASSFLELKSLQKLHGHNDYYRIRVGDYRIGIVVNESTFTFVRVLHRKDIYRHFP